MVIIEAMQCGCVPVVYGTYAAAHDIISDGTDGYVVMPLDENDYVNKLAYLMDNDDARRRMGVEAIRSSRRFDADAIIDQWEKLLKIR